MVAARPQLSQLWTWLGQIADPEIPVLSIVDLGIVREVRWDAEPDELVIAMTPTYSGCPVMDVIASEILSSMKEHGIERIRLETKLSPAWTTDWLNDAAKEKLRDYGIAPPERLITIAEGHVACPRCGSKRTALISLYGSTPCKALYKCQSCLEPFDAFKRH